MRKKAKKRNKPLPGNKQMISNKEQRRIFARNNTQEALEDIAVIEDVLRKRARLRFFKKLISKVLWGGGIILFAWLGLYSIECLKADVVNHDNSFLPIHRFIYGLGILLPTSVVFLFLYVFILPKKLMETFSPLIIMLIYSAIGSLTINSGKKEREEIYNKGIKRETYAKLTDNFVENDTRKYEYVFYVRDQEYFGECDDDFGVFKEGDSIRIIYSEKRPYIHKYDVRGLLSPVQ